MFKTERFRFIVFAAGEFALEIDVKVPYSGQKRAKVLKYSLDSQPFLYTSTLSVCLVPACNKITILVHIKY